MTHILDGPGGIPVGTDPKRVFPLNFQDVGDFRENVCDGSVFHVRPVREGRMKDYTPGIRSAKGGLRKNRGEEKPKRGKGEYPLD